MALYSSRRLILLRELVALNKRSVRVACLLNTADRSLEGGNWGTLRLLIDLLVDLLLLFNGEELPDLFDLLLDLWRGVVDVEVLLLTDL